MSRLLSPLPDKVSPLARKLLPVAMGSAGPSSEIEEQLDAREVAMGRGVVGAEGGKLFELVDGVAKVPRIEEKARQTFVGGGVFRLTVDGSPEEVARPMAALQVRDERGVEAGSGRVPLARRDRHHG